MANFFISTLVGEVNSIKNSVVSTFENHPFYTLFDDNETWKEDKISGRLNNLTIQKSGYNEIIPVVYGTNRLAGNIIWGTDIKEVQRSYVTSYEAGKGGEKVYQNNIEYYYYANIAIAICKGEVRELKKVWADTDLIDIYKYEHRFYNGTSDQLPDPFIQSIQGYNSTPAYRDLCYIVFENLPLAEFGNRIPNFTFEVERNFVDTEDVESMITGVNIIPACGEFVYDTEIVSRENGFIWNNIWRPTGDITRINQNTNSNTSDAVVSTQQLKEKLPNCQWVSPVVVWFGDSLNIADCSITPRVEFKMHADYETEVTRPEDWNVAGVDRRDAILISTDKDGKPRYGGTIHDNSVVNYLKHLKENGYKIMFYPMIFMDIENKPWRGYLGGESEDLNSFFTKEDGYNAFILHYANLVKDYVDAFIIGSELRNLTKIKDAENNFLAIDYFIDLARQVKEVLNTNIEGKDIKVSYAADWSEYHHTDGGWYNMDKLWASEYIDFIGIDAYFPLTDKKESLITEQDIMDGWASGEGYEWIYTDAERLTKEPIEDKYAWKNIKWWWENEHINPDDIKTNWLPKSKEIWFTEYGFASVDGTSNEPNRFYDPNSIDGGFPRFSEGKIDYFAQRKAIKATEKFWKNSEMVKQKFLWCWDARPYPFFPNKLEKWSDGNIWHYGHWINGKLGNLIFSNMIRNLFHDADVDYSYLGGTNIEESIDGIVLNNKININQVLTILQKIFFFDFYEKDGKLYIFSKQEESVVKIFDDDLIKIDSDNYIKTDIIGEDEIPYKIDVSYINKDFDYQVCNIYAERSSVNTRKKESESLPIVISQSRAREIVNKLLYSTWLERQIYHFKLPTKYIYLNVADVITLNTNDTDLNLRIISIYINDDNTIEIKAVKCDNSIYKFKKEEEDFSNINTLLPTGKTNIKIFELPAIQNNELPELFFATNGEENSWKGCGIYFAKTGSNNFSLLNENRINSIAGICLNKLETGQPYYLDKKNELNIAFNSNIDTSLLENIELFDFLDLGNLALVGNEVIQFKKAELQEDGHFKLSELLRGQFGTEEHISTHKENETFIFLNQTIISNKLTKNDINITYDFKTITFDDNFENSTDETFKIEGKNLKNLNPIHIKIDKIDIGYSIDWKHRKKGISSWIDGEETAENTKYKIQIINKINKDILRETIVENSTKWLYTNEMILEDDLDKWEVEIVNIS